ncbi:Serine/threonine-protein kinase-like protein [Hapsidospora chrysogenum ATCC 11550]|uniref:non-specific serine/threonine protein kinase n=1 Tax=Hapsidospora chrysogenum (strain ATCC 11550 / CBS 779.69 / DSM 880 / IAM 14645 / JCM 23072 / IMI 49137) TaxID=857340 RepID=A0A086T8J1_HAPC1|nr:Serine/threonine-protein kinase-like protein [Hapsidospora chrysogenum ATCC 11550]
MDRRTIVGKLGLGATSTVWLARDLRFLLIDSRNFDSHRRHVTLTVFVHAESMGSQLDDEMNIYKLIEAGPKRRPGYGAVRSLLDSFDVESPDGKHRCLVHPPLFESILTFLRRNPIGGLPVPIVAFVLKRLFLALDFLHTDALVLYDFSSAVLGVTRSTTKMSSPISIRAPESRGYFKFTSGTLGVWSGTFFEGGNLFTSQDPEYGAYRSRAHIAEISALLGPPPLDLLSRSTLAHKFFSGETFSRGILVPRRTFLEDIKTNLGGQD